MHPSKIVLFPRNVGCFPDLPDRPIARSWGRSCSDACAGALTRVTRQEKGNNLVIPNSRHLDDIIKARDLAQDSRNFWKWAAVASWIFIALAAVLTIIPFR